MTAQSLRVVVSRAVMVGIGLTGPAWETVPVIRAPRAESYGTSL